MIDNGGIKSMFRIGDFVRVKESIRSPHAGRVGVIVGIDSRDTYGTHLVRFDDGLRFRYTGEELETDRAVKLSNSRAASLINNPQL
jgi:hypothetical protein